MAKYRYWSIGGGWRGEDGRISWSINAADVAKVAEESGRPKLRVFIEEVMEKKSEKSPDYTIKAIIGEAQGAPKPKATEQEMPF